MEMDELLACLKTKPGDFPREALKEAVARREEITPHLLQILEETTRNATEIASRQSDSIGHIYALMLLAQFREAKAYPLIVQLFSLQGDTPLDLTEGIATEYLDRILASVCHSDLSGIERLIKDPSVNQWVRGAAAGAIPVMVWAGLMSREAAVDFYRNLFRGGLERRPSNAWNALVSCATDL